MSEDLDWEPTPPDQAQRNFDHRVAMIQHELVCAADGNNLAFRVSHAMYSLELSLDAGQRLTCERRRDIMLRAADGAQAHTRLLFPYWDRDHVAAGFDAFAGQLIFWCETDVERHVWRPADLADIRAVARRLRNDFHSACLVASVDDAREMYRTNKIDARKLSNIVRGSFERLVANEIHNTALADEVRSRSDNRRSGLASVG